MSHKVYEILPLEGSFHNMGAANVYNKILFPIFSIFIRFSHAKMHEKEHKKFLYFCWCFQRIAYNNTEVSVSLLLLKLLFTRSWGTQKDPFLCSDPVKVFYFFQILLAFSTSSIHPDIFICFYRSTKFLSNLEHVFTGKRLTGSVSTLWSQSAVEPISVLLHRTLNLVIMCCQNTLWVSVGSEVVFVIAVNLHG